MHRVFLVIIDIYANADIGPFMVYWKQPSVGWKKPFREINLKCVKC